MRTSSSAARAAVLALLTAPAVLTAQSLPLSVVQWLMFGDSTAAHQVSR